jgi:predicted ATP-grasp superfamily ATP-dependent carboligase
MTDLPVTSPSPTPELPAGKGAADGYDVLILDAGSRQSLAAVRSLGRAGLRVAVGECFAECDPSLPVLAFRSRYCARRVVLPSYATDAAAFAAGVIEFVGNHPTRVVVPGSDGAIAALAPVREHLASLGSTLALAADPELEIANDKDRTLEIARGLGIDYPKSVLIESIDQVPGLVAELDFPIVLKPTSSWAARSVVRLQATEVVDAREANEVIAKFLAAGVKVVAQQWVGGEREALMLFVVNGEVLASCAQVAHRTSPALGGASVLRESVPIRPDVYGSAVRLVNAIGLDGLCEVEYRRDLGDRPYLMEINARLAGTLENAIRSGVDFPLLLWQWATGERVDRVGSYRIGVKTRWLRGDMRWLRDNFRRAGRPDSLSRNRAVWTFIAEFARTPHYDCLDLADIGPFLAEARTTLAAVRRSRTSVPAAGRPHPRGAIDAR